MWNEIVSGESLCEIYFGVKIEDLSSLMLDEVSSFSLDIDSILY